MLLHKHASIREIRDRGWLIELYVTPRVCGFIGLFVVEVVQFGIGIVVFFVFCYYFWLRTSQQRIRLLRYFSDNGNYIGSFSH